MQTQTRMRLVLVQQLQQPAVMLVVMGRTRRMAQTLQLQAPCTSLGLSCRARCLMTQQLTGQMHWWLTGQPSWASFCVHLCWRTCQTWLACAGG